MIFRKSPQNHSMHDKMSDKVYTLRKGDAHVAVWHRRMKYLVGFTKVVHARNVHYNIMMDPQLILLRDTNIDLHKDLWDSGYDMHLNLDVKATLFIPKNQHRFVDSMYDGGFTMHTIDTSDFLKCPVLATKPCGIVMPYELIDETESEYMFQAFVVDPLEPLTESM